MTKLNTEDVKNTLFSFNKKQKEVEKPSQHIEEANTTIAQVDTGLAKWQHFDKVSVLITPEQREKLDQLAKKAMRYRSRVKLKAEDRERVTANTILRALLQNFLERESLLSDAIINNEQDAKIWIEKLFKT